MTSELQAERRFSPALACRRKCRSAQNDTTHHSERSGGFGPSRLSRLARRYPGAVPEAMALAEVADASRQRIRVVSRVQTLVPGDGGLFIIQS
jgi:soluble lytic murein transglycosylase-like protein